MSRYNNDYPHLIHVQYIIYPCASIATPIIKQLKFNEVTLKDI